MDRSVTEADSAGRTIPGTGRPLTEVGFSTKPALALANIIVTHYDKSVKSPTNKPPKRGRPITGVALTPAERMRRMRARRKSAGLRAVVTWKPAESAVSAPYSGHRLLEARSLAMHAVIAAKIMRDPGLLAKPRENIERWSARFGKKPPRWIAQWRHLLALSCSQIAAFITTPSEEAARLRQSTPFAGILTVQERRRIYEAFRA